MVDIQTNPLYYATVGGLILGISISLHYMFKGNVTGMSDIVYGVVSFNKQQMPNKLGIIGGMFIAGGIFFDIFGYETSNKFTPFGPMQDIDQKTSFLGFALAGLLVGFGTKFGNGCTSGHGLCGLSRLSTRSLAAVITFLISGMGIGTIRYYFGLGPFTSEDLSPQIEYNHLVSANIFIVLGIVFLFIGLFLQKKLNKVQQQWCEVIRDLIISWSVGLLFGCGLLVSGMCRRINILAFLWAGQDWNPSLLFVLTPGLLVGLITFNYMLRVRKNPYYGERLFNPSGDIDWKLIVGALMFGLGWGIGGICPGPAIVLFPVWTVPIHLIWFTCVLIGMAIGSRVKKCCKGVDEVSDVQLPQKSNEVSNEVLNEVSRENISSPEKIKSRKHLQILKATNEVEDHIIQ